MAATLQRFAEKWEETYEEADSLLVKYLQGGVVDPLQINKAIKNLRLLAQLSEGMILLIEDPDLDCDD